MSQKVKGIILAGGSATRLSELTRVTNKHLLPVGDFPMIYYPLRALEQAGIKEVCLITGVEHAGSFIDLLGTGKVIDRQGNQIFDLDITYRMQPNSVMPDGKLKPGGIPDAIRQARNFAGSDKVVVFLGDNIIEGNIIDSVKKFAEQDGGARILLKEVKNPQAYGVPEFDAQGNIINLEEKPSEPKSNFASIGIYMYDNKVFDYIETLKPSARGELEVPDLSKCYLNDGKLSYDILHGWWRDGGQSPRDLAEISNLIYQTGVNKIRL